MVHYIHQFPDLIPGSFRISDEIPLGRRFRHRKRLIRSHSIDMNKIKFFIGYSGWESGQLDSELQENSWLTANATRKIVLMFPWKTYGKKASNTWEANTRSWSTSYRPTIELTESLPHVAVQHSENTRPDRTGHLLPRSEDQ